jgi:DNA end-binding protein Ku
MAARATWKGVLQISLVTVPIKVYPATESSESISFNQLHERTASTDEVHAGELCHARVQQKRWCAKCDREVPTTEIVKGFEFEKGKYVILHDAELDAVKPESTRVIKLSQFVDASELEPQSIDRSYYLAPDGPIAAQAVAVLQIAMRHRVGIGKLALYGREYLVAVRPARVPASATSQVVLMLHTLHHAAELRSVETIDDLQTGAQASVDQVKLAQQVIAAYMGPLDLADFTDDYQADLRRLIDDKVAGNEIVHVPAPQPTPVLSLPDALQLSLEAVSAAKKRAAKVPAITEASRLAKRRREAS